MKKRGRRRIRSPEYWRAYYTRKQREWRAAHYWHAYYTRKKREQRAARRLVEKRRKEKIARSEEHTSELQSQSNLVCRLLLEKKKTKITDADVTRLHGAHTRHS